MQPKRTTKADVYQAAKQLLAEDLSSSVNRVRVKLGINSFKSITQHLKPFKDNYHATLSQLEKRRGNFPDDPQYFLNKRDIKLSMAPKQGASTSRMVSLETKLSEKEAEVEALKAQLQTLTIEMENIKANCDILTPIRQNSIRPLE